MSCRRRKCKVGGVPMAQLVGTLAQVCRHICKELEAHTMTVLGWDTQMSTHRLGAAATSELTVRAVIFRVLGCMKVSFLVYFFCFFKMEDLQTDGIEVKKACFSNVMEVSEGGGNSCEILGGDFGDQFFGCWIMFVVPDVKVLLNLSSLMEELTATPVVIVA